MHCTQYSYYTNISFSTKLKLQQRGAARSSVDGCFGRHRRWVDTYEELANSPGIGLEASTAAIKQHGGSTTRQLSAAESCAADWPGSGFDKGAAAAETAQGSG